MIGIIVQLTLSWLIIWLFDRWYASKKSGWKGKNNLNVLGLLPTRRRLLDFALFFFITAACCSLEYLLRILFARQQWELNPALAPGPILSGIWWNIKSVLFEELIFRGVLLYILINLAGTPKAIIISAIAFGMYHWFSHQTFGKPVEMVFTFVTTGAMGLLFAYGYTKTFSLYVPCAIHLGWNLVRSVVFSEMVIGDQLLIQVKPVPEVTVSYFVFFCILLLPMLSVLTINYFLLKKRMRVEQA